MKLCDSVNNNTKGESTRDEQLRLYGLMRFAPHRKTLSRAIIGLGMCAAMSACVADTPVTPAPVDTSPTMTDPSTDPITPRGEIMSGTFIGPGVTCPQFRLDSGEQVSLSGVTNGMQVGVRYKLDAIEARLSKCMQGREFRVFAVVD